MQIRIGRVWCACAAALLPAAAALLAQYGTGVILGTVSDPSGAAIPGVTVTVNDNATNETRTFVTDAQGNYRFPALPSGTYSVTATQASFKTATAPNIVLPVNSQTRVDLVMELGSVNERVEVQAEVPQLQTDTAAVGTVIDKRTLLELPLNARNFYDLVALTPTVVKGFSTSTVMDQRTVALGGTRGTSVGFNLDGVDFSVVNLNNPAVALSLDAIAEFKVQVNFMDASYGHGSSFIDMVTPRGTNSFHGVAFDFVRNRAFQAGQFFRPPQGAPRFSYNQFGASAGGPLVKDKTFIFGNYEGRRRRTGSILQGLVPTPEMHRGDFSGLGRAIRDPFNNNLPFPGNVIPSNRFDPISSRLLEYFPAPNFVGTRAGVNYLVTPSDTETRDQFTIRVDQRVSDKGSLFGRYTLGDIEVLDAAYRPGKGQLAPNRHQQAAIGYTHVFSPNLVSETRLGFLKAFLSATTDGDRFSTNYAKELGFKNLVGEPGDFTLPSLNVTGYAPGFPRNVSGFGGYGFRIVQNNIYYRFGQTVTYIRGRHTLKIGGDISRLMVGYDQGSAQNGLFTFGGTFTGDSFADFLLGIPLAAQGGLGSVGDFGGVAKYSIGTQFQWYIQDDWKITDRLTLNLGLRHELFQQWRGRLANFDLGTGRQLLANRADYFVPGVGLVRGTGPALLRERPIDTDFNDFAPRLGVAYRLGSKTTIRAGAGVFYDLNVASFALGRMTSTPPFFVIANMTSSPTRPELRLSQLFPTAEETPTSVSGNVDLRRRSGYIYQYNLNIQHQVRPGLLVETGYMGNTGHKLGGLSGLVLVNQPRLPLDPNNPEPFAARMPYPRFVPTFNQTANFGWSNYNAFFVKMEQRVTSGLSYTASYTFSKLMDSGGAGQNMYNRRPERGLADTDVPHNFIASYVYELPLGKGRRWSISNPVLNAIAGGWQVGGITSFQSGMPLTIVTVGDIANVATGGQRANAAGPKPRLLDPRTTNLVGFDTSAYAVPARGTFGNLARSTQRGFGFNNWDFSANKNFALRWLGESSRLQIRTEWFNFFNHTQFRGLGTVANVPATFGLVNSTWDPRILQLAAKLYW